MEKIIKKDIQDVSDTALWIAAYRAQETGRKDALFHDSFASLLVGPHGLDLANRTQGSRYTAWSVVIRTYIIDQFICDLLAQEKIDTVLNLGAGLDTRPYRLSLPEDLNWIEVDFPHIIDLKTEKLKSEKPKCSLERIKLDLSVEKNRNEFLESVSQKSHKTLVLTEGVIPYLSNTDASSLAQALYKYKNFSHWITEYYSPEILKFLRTPKRLKQMQNAPFLFYPPDWFGFFKEHGWHEVQTKYFALVSEKLGRTPPTPGWMKNHEEKNLADRYLGYTLLSR